MSIQSDLSLSASGAGSIQLKCVLGLWDFIFYGILLIQPFVVIGLFVGKYMWI